MASILLENIVSCLSWLLEEERINGNTFSSVCMGSRHRKAGKRMNFRYGELSIVYDIINKEINSSHLIEHVSKNLDRLFEQIPQIVRLSKLNPPLGGKVEKASIEISGKRSDPC